MEFGFFQQCLYPCLLQNVNTGTGIEVVYSLGCPYPTQIDPSRSMFASMFWDHMNYIPHLIMVWSPSSTSSEKNIRLFFGDADWPIHWKVMPLSRIPGMMMHQQNGYLGTWWVLGCHDSMIIDSSSHEWNTRNQLQVQWCCFLEMQKTFLGNPNCHGKSYFFMSIDFVGVLIRWKGDLLMQRLAPIRSICNPSFVRVVHITAQTVRWKVLV